MVYVIPVLYLDSIRDVLKDPSFEHGQPSWVRRSQSFYQSASLPVCLGFTTGKATPTYNSASLSRDEVDQATSAVADETEEIVTEFMDEGEEERWRVLSLKVCNFIIVLPLRLCMWLEDFTGIKSDILCGPLYCL